MKLNVRDVIDVRTHEDGPATPIDALKELRRAVMACFLWEDTFYESGVSIAERIENLCIGVRPADIAALAIEARTKGNLRHVPLLLLVHLCRHGAGSSLVSDTIATTVQRADELAELLALYWKNGKRPLSAQLKKGLAKAFGKFNQYQLAKYNRDAKIKLRDVMFLTHPKPKDGAQELVYLMLAEQKLAAPDTWEVALSGGAGKRETFERLLIENKLGYLALLRNLRNMEEAGCNRAIVRQAILERRGAERVLPFRYVAAAKHAPAFDKELDEALQATIKELPLLEGSTAVLVDVSVSMVGAKVSRKSDLNRRDAAAALAAIINADDLDVYVFADYVAQVAARRGLAGVDLIHAQRSGGTQMGAAIKLVSERKIYDRLIVITDEQSQDEVVWPSTGRCYCINVAGYRNGVSYQKNVVHIDGFSENVIRYIYELEQLEATSE